MKIGGGRKTTADLLKYIEQTRANRTHNSYTSFESKPNETSKNSYRMQADSNSNKNMRKGNDRH